MLTSSPAVLLALALLVSTTAIAQPQTLPCETGTRRLELKAEPTREMPEVCIGPGLSTTLLFYGAELLSDGVAVDDRERFTWVDPGNTVLRLMPSARVVPGDRFRLTVRFKDGEAPASAAFWLVVYPGQVEPLVEVYREKRTVESYQQEGKEKEAQLRQCREDNERLLAEKEGPGGLAGLLTTGLMDMNGVAAKDISESIVQHPGNVAPIATAYSYLSARTVAVELFFLRPTVEMPPWRAARAELVGPERRTLRVNPPWQSEPFRSGVKDKRVIIEAEVTEGEARGSFTLKVWNEDGTRSITVSGITFP